VPQGDSDLESAPDELVLQQSLSVPERFALLFDRHATAVHHYLARRIGSALADDLMAETFLVAFRGRSAFRPSQLDVRPWLLGIATNLVRRHGRDEQRRYRALSRLCLQRDPVLSEIDEAVDRVDAGSLRARLAGALVKVKPPDREVLLLFAWAQLSYAEIATVLNIPVGTVRSRLNRARRITRALLPPDLSREDTP
jgi:RNA polymerase sigma factor (sigma-70 family)